MSTPLSGTVDPSGSATDVMFSVRGLWKIFGRDSDKVIGTELEKADRDRVREETGCTVAVRDVSFDVRPGEVFVVMGLSGSGKSTLIRCLTRLVEPTAGRVLLDGEDIGEATPQRLRELRRHQPDLIMADYLMPGMNGAEFIAAARKLYPHIPVLVATGYADMAEVERLVGTESILKKPFDLRVFNL